MTSAKRKTRGSRGVSLVEVIVASGVLIIGMTGITAMLMRGAVNGRLGQQTMVASQYGEQALDELTTQGFQSLTPQVGATFAAGDGIDAGYFIDGSGRWYQSAFIVTDLGGAWPTYRVDVQTEYIDGAGVSRVQSHSAILSKIPDAG